MSVTKDSDNVLDFFFFPTVGRREGKEGAAGAAAPRPAEFREVPRPPPARGPESQGWSPPNLEAAEGSRMAPARGLNLRVAEGPGPWRPRPRRSPARRPRPRHSPWLPRRRWRQRPGSRTWQLPAAPRQRTSGARPVGGWRRKPPGRNVPRPQEGSAPFSGCGAPSYGPAHPREELARPPRALVAMATRTQPRLVPEGRSRGATFLTPPASLDARSRQPFPCRSGCVQPYGDYGRTVAFGDRRWSGASAALWLVPRQDPRLGPGAEKARGIPSPRD